MNQQEGCLLLLRSAQMLALDASLDVVTAKNRADAQTLVSELSGFPPALSQAGTSINASSCSLSDYLERYRKRHQECLHSGWYPSPHLNAVATTFSLSYEQIEQKSLTAADLLRLCAFLYPESIPEEIMVSGAR